MNFDDIVDKSTKAVKDGADKIDDARNSEKAAKVRDDIVDGFGKLMKAVLPGQHKAKTEQAAQRVVEGGEPITPKEIPPKK